MRHLIIGNGAAGIHAAETIRERDETAAIVLLDREPHRSYYRMMLPDFISGWKELDALFAVKESFYEHNRIDFRPSTEAVSVDASRHSLQTAAGETLEYDRLLIAAGAQPRLPLLPGIHLDGVVSLRTLDQALDIIRRLRDARSAVTLGGGLLGVELARSFNERGIQSNYLIREDRFWPQMLDHAGSSIIEALLARNGIRLAKEETVATIEGESSVRGVVTSRGRQIESQIVGMSVGVAPALGFLEHSGLEIEGGIVVDDGMRTNLPDIYAAGDIAAAFDVAHGEHRVTTSYLNARRQGGVAGANMSGAAESLGGVVPLNLIRIYGLPVACMGISLPPDDSYEVHAGPFPQGDEYRNLVLKDGVLVGATLIGDVRRSRRLEEMIRDQARIDDPVRELLA
ncbi:MAG: NAD(P)/FAD-dependent oxidoreductase [Candidatus Geothermincolia bacterium]